MLSLPDRASVERAIVEVEEGLSALLAARLAISIENKVADLSHYLIIRPDDQEDTVLAAAGFSPLVNPIDHCRYPDPGFHPWWDYLNNVGGWFEMIMTVGDTGFAVILLIEDCKNAHTDILELCRTYNQ